MKIRNLALCFIICLIQPLFSQWLNPPWNWPITSDYGPRKVSKGTWFHRGIDYGGPNGADIKAVEGGVIKTIETDSLGVCYITIQGSHGDWKYLHIFSSGPLPRTSGNWELAKATLVHPVQGTQPTTIIILWANRGQRQAIKVLCINRLNGSRVILGTETINDVFGNEIRSRGSVEDNEIIAPVGTSGGFPAHLHLSLNHNPQTNTSDNPLYHLLHPPDKLPTITIEQPKNGYVIKNKELKEDVIKVKIDSTQGLDLDKVNLAIYKHKDPNQAINLETNPTYNYGGRPGENRTTLTVDKTGNVYVEPISNGLDRFIASYNFSSLPEGTHSLFVEARDVNDHIATFTSDFRVDTTPPQIKKVRITSGTKTTKVENVWNDFILCYGP
ncbi:MAG: M23 family metallopeptidase, partial [bacterium]